MASRIVTADVRPMTQADLPVADRIMRAAFGTFLGLPNPDDFVGDGSYIDHRWASSSVASYVAVVDGQIVGSNMATRWGSFGYFGPLTVRPDFWNAGIGQQLMAPVMDTFSDWRVTLAGLFTFPHSTKHIGTYQKFGFRPRCLTPIVSKEVTGGDAPVIFSALSETERRAVLDQCTALTDADYPGLDVTGEIIHIAARQLGETVLVTDGSRVTAFAVCHHGAGTEAGSAACYAKFAAAQTRGAFESLLTACEAYTASKDLPRFTAGINTARTEAYDILLQRGYRADFVGVAMHRPNDPGWSRPGVYVLDDWR